MAKSKKGEKPRKQISSLTMLMILLVVLGAFTWLISAISNGAVTGATLADLVTSPLYGFTGAPEDVVSASANPATFPGGALEVCSFVMVLGGFLGVMTKTGALDAGIAALVKKMGGNELMLIPILMFIFSVGGTTYGMWEESVPFYLLIAATMYAAGFDAMVGAAVVLMGTASGVIGSTVNPFVVGIAVSSLTDSGIAVNNGIVMALGAILWLACLAISVAYIMRYAAKVKAEKGRSILTRAEWDECDQAFSGFKMDDVTLAKKQKYALIVFAIAFVIMIVGFIPWEDFGITVFLGWSGVLTRLPLGEWYFIEAAAWFLILAIVIGNIGGLSESELVESFVAGVADIMNVVLVIALARGVSILMAETGLTDWILACASNALQGTPVFVFAPASWVVYALLSFIVTSSSGMATVSMPIMGPLAANLGFSVEAMVMIYSSANGLINVITPACGVMMGGLSLAHLQYSTWLKWVGKLVAILAVTCMVICTVAMMIL